MQINQLKEAVERLQTGRININESDILLMKDTLKLIKQVPLEKKKNFHKFLLAWLNCEHEDEFKTPLKVHRIESYNVSTIQKRKMDDGSVYNGS